MADDQCRVQVALRVRPLSTKEAIEDSKSCVRVAPHGDPNQLMIGTNKLFTFDKVIGPEQGQSDVYSGCVKEQKPMLVCYHWAPQPVALAH